MQFQTLRAVISLEIFRVEVGKEAIQLKGFMVICVRAVENVELGSYLYFNPTDTFFSNKFQFTAEAGASVPSPRGTYSSQVFCPPRRNTGSTKESGSPGERVVQRWDPALEDWTWAPLL